MHFRHLCFLYIFWLSMKYSKALDNKTRALCKQIMSPRKIDGNRIVGGKEAKPHSYPSILSLHRYGYHICGATIINSEWAVTAAHCWDDVYDVDKTTFVAGEHRMDVQEGEQFVTAINVVVHPEYSEDTKWNDLALFQVSPPFRFNSNVRPAELPWRGYRPQGKIMVAGWGLLSEGGALPQALQEVRVNIIDTAKCDKWYVQKTLTNKQICAGLEEGGKDSCQGDSGGPLYDLTGGKQILIGVVSFGRGCARRDYPGIYSRVSEYLDWIQGVTYAGRKKRSASSSRHRRNLYGNGTSRVKKRSPLRATVGFSTSVVEQLCVQKETFDSTGRMPPPVKEKPSSRTAYCGVFTWLNCDENYYAKLMTAGC